MTEQGMNRQLSLLYALIDPDLYPTEDFKGYAFKTPEKVEAESHRDNDRMTKLDKNPQAKKKAREALYKALYTITEYPDVNRDLNRVIARALSHAIRGDIPDLKGDRDIGRLYEILQPIIREAIDEVV